MTDTIVKNSAAAVTNWFIDMNREPRVDLTRLKVQKLLYFAQGWHLAYFDSPLFEDNIHAWRFGPVVETIYQALKFRGKEEIIKAYVPGYAFEAGNFRMEDAPRLTFASDEIKSFVESFWGQYSGLPPWHLVTSSHMEGSPWHQVTSSPKYDRYTNSLIPSGLIRSYFKSSLPEES
ncbi:MAG: DUF4065 domain-containing protein [Deltaproteobacteria bacterium]|jgi:uncharacterized phage-associated protein|nr:DUF4065 domain-containing protein [Deltaproteobacteria bacterium]